MSIIYYRHDIGIAFVYLRMMPRVLLTSEHLAASYVHWSRSLSVVSPSGVLVGARFVMKAIF